MTVTQLQPTAPASAPAAGLAIAGKATIFGLVIFLVGGLLLTAAAMIGGGGSSLIYALVAVAAPLLLAFLVQRFGAWPLVFTALLMLAYLAANAPYIPDALQHPDSFFDFAANVFGLAGGVISLTAAITGLITSGRRPLRSAPTKSERRAAGAILGALVALTVLSGVLTLAGRESVSAEARAGALPLRMKGTDFQPQRLEARAGGPVRLVVKNDDPGAHSFAVKSLGVDVTVKPGDERLIELPALEAGEYPFVCTLFGHESVMKGTLVVAP